MLGSRYEACIVVNSVVACCPSCMQVDTTCHNKLVHILGNMILTTECKLNMCWSTVWSIESGKVIEECSSFSSRVLQVWFLDFTVIVSGVYR
jgi:hypothetical protein